MKLGLLTIILARGYGDGEAGKVVFFVLDVAVVLLGPAFVLDTIIQRYTPRRSRFSDRQFLGFNYWLLHLLVAGCSIVLALGVVFLAGTYLSGMFSLLLGVLYVLWRVTRFFIR